MNNSRAVRQIIFSVVFLVIAFAANAAEPVTLKVGHVGHDHHTALFVAADNSAKFAKETGISLKVVKDKQFYDLYDGKEKIANVEFVKVGGGSKMPTALAQNIIELGLGGIAAVLATADKGAPVKLVAPLHSKGDMFVTRPDFPAKTWKEFVAVAKRTKKPIRVGYKSPMAVAKIVFEEALKHEGISFSGNPADAKVQVLMINVKGGGKLNVALTSKVVDGYVGNNPFPAIGLEKGILRVVSDLEELPPGTFLNHPCCCIGANTRAIEKKRRAMEAMMVLLLQATEAMNKDLDLAVASASRWIGTSEKVERDSLPTSGFSMDASKAWRGHVAQWVDAMNRLEAFKGGLKDLNEKQVAAKAYDLSLLTNAKKRLARARGE